MDHGSSLARVESEMNRGWATTNPELFNKSVWEFQDEYPIEEWKHSIDLSRAKYITLIAYRREVPYDHARDFLTEIGMK